MTIDTDTVLTNAPYLVATIHPYPKLATTRRINDGDDIEAILLEEAGGSFENIELKDHERSLGIVRIVKNGATSVHIHSHPDAEMIMQDLIQQQQAQLTFTKIMQDAGLIKEPRADGCICGMCPPLDGANEEAAYAGGDGEN